LDFFLHSIYGVPHPRSSVGGSTYSWSAPKTIGLLVTFSVLFNAFVVVEVLTPETAMAPNPSRPEPNPWHHLPGKP
jgi:hypothetical protein